MKISKHIHSCLLVEDQGKVVLIDPGNYSYDAKALDINQLNQLDAIVITHGHMDHMYIPWIKEILQKFPNIPIYTNPSARKLLQQEGINNVYTEGNEFITMKPLSHEKVFDKQTVVENCSIRLFNTFTSVGDSFGFTDETDSIAFPVAAPWGSLTQAMNVASTIKTKVMIPIHDYHWKDEFRKEFYKRCHEFLVQFGIDFKVVETGEVVEV